MFINSGKAMMEMPHPQDINGSILINIPAIRPFDQPEHIRAWVTPRERICMQEAAEPYTLTAVLLGRSQNLGFLQWGDEVQIIVMPGRMAELDLRWMSSILRGKIQPTPKDNIPRPVIRGCCKRKKQRAASDNA